ncbi:DNA mismatch repair protein [Leptospira langatensis]|uniref:DNA mismatch repair protein n=1 Tax=Leptospira langatensis TaxID=2484983 RepID=A0A5F1ZUN7_9LEPT|nr:MutS family DNA mismatch repair protein [Leptospira langatensis]TGK01558.1 DNA mismatch repair protein [Leptospira langatensis]TGL41992.1 DNA mismatch repair protein [Leptospira langatensis]
MKTLKRVDRLDRNISRLDWIVRKEESTLSYLSAFRLIAFLGFIAWVVGVYLLRLDSELFYLPAILILAGFYKLLSLYQDHKDKIRRSKIWIDLLKTQKARILLDARSYPKVKKEYYKNLLLSSDLPSWTKDLDFLGEKGIFSRIDTTVLPKANSGFLHYFWDRSEEDRIRARQSAVQALSSKERTAQKLLRQLRLYEASFPARKEGEEEKLPSYIPKFKGLSAEQSDTEKQDFPFHLFTDRPTDFWTNALGKFGSTIRFLFPIWVVLVWIIVLGSFLFDQTWGFGFFLLNLSFFGFYRGISLKMIRPIAEDSETLGELGKLLSYLRSANLGSVRGEVYLSNWTQKGLRSYWKRLQKIADLAAYTQSPLAHSLLNVLFLFDLWVWRRYANWWKEKGESVLSAFEDLAELDSLLPLANLKWIEPDFSFPILEKENSPEALISAKDLVHPLIPSDKRVANDLDPMFPGKLLLLTGSNMSGKTTYLRALGISGILAMAGAPVPSSEFKTPILEVYTSIRNEDSVDEGISFFYAEVRRLGSILQEVSDKSRARLVLLDEILKGTNSRERTIACKGILNKLREYNVFGMITTHDLELADLPDLSLFHFREEIKDGKMTFDYKIRSGVVQSSNALEVLRLEGLDLN